MRKRIYDAVTNLESWKISIMDRDVAAQLTKIKSLNLLGETLERFETWKTRWDDIITQELLEVEEFLFDAESAADGYRFKTAKEIVHKTEQVLKTIERDIDQILQELNELLVSEENSREEMVELEPTLKVLRRQLSQRRYQYGKAESIYDEMIDALEEQIITYHELVDTGDYLQAKDLVDSLEEDTEKMKHKMEEFPELYKAHRFELPQQLDELRSGMEEMLNDGYRIGHLEFEKEVYRYEQRLKESQEQLEAGEVTEAKALIVELENRIKEIYDVLEKEAVAKSYVESQIPFYRTTLDEIDASFTETKLEVEKMKQAYHFEDRDLEKYLSLDKMLSHLRGQLADMEAEEVNENEKSHLELRQELEHGFEQIEELKEKFAAFHKRIHNLRKDELEAEGQLYDLEDDLSNIRRNLRRSNLPGVPNYVWSQIEQAGSKLQNVVKTLEKQPLDISEVQEALQIADQGIIQVAESTELMLEQAELTEQVIQYANRYRSRDAILAAGLIESERLFRKFEYELALEHAAKAVERTEPGALKHIESLNTNTHE